MPIAAVMQSLWAATSRPSRLFLALITYSYGVILVEYTPNRGCIPTIVCEAVRVRWGGDVGHGSRVVLSSTQIEFAAVLYAIYSVPSAFFDSNTAFTDPAVQVGSIVAVVVTVIDATLLLRPDACRST